MGSCNRSRNGETGVAKILARAFHERKPCPRSIGFLLKLLSVLQAPLPTKALFSSPVRYNFLRGRRLLGRLWNDTSQVNATRDWDIRNQVVISGMVFRRASDPLRSCLLRQGNATHFLIVFVYQNMVPGSLELRLTAVLTEACLFKGDALGQDDVFVLLYQALSIEIRISAFLNLMPMLIHNSSRSPNLPSLENVKAQEVASYLSSRPRLEKFSNPAEIKRCWI